MLSQLAHAGLWHDLTGSNRYAWDGLGIAMVAVKMDDSAGNVTRG